MVQLTIRTQSNVAAVALANRLARMDWAVLTKNEPCRPPMLVGAATECLACRGRLAKARLGNRIRDSHIYRPSYASSLAPSMCRCALNFEPQLEVSRPLCAVLWKSNFDSVVKKDRGPKTRRCDLKPLSIACRRRPASQQSPTGDRLR